MLELGRREQHLMGGIGFNILIVGLLVFAYTQAIRQVKLNKELSLRLQEQLTVAREKVAQEGGRLEPAKLQAKLEELKSTLIPHSALEPQARRLEQLAQQRFGIEDVKVKARETPSEKISVPLEGQPDFEVHLYSLEMKGTAGSRPIAGLLSSVADPSFKPFCPLVAMELKTVAPDTGRPVEFVLRWMIAVSPDPATASPGQGLPSPGRPPAWGWREEPFLSPITHPGALRLPAEKLASLRLSGILQQGNSFTCVINGRVLKAGEWVGGYQLVLITPDAVLLEGKGEELLLRLP